MAMSGSEARRVMMSENEGHDGDAPHHDVEGPEEMRLMVTSRARSMAMHNFASNDSPRRL